jgi:predicted dehydrogenase
MTHKARIAIVGTGWWSTFTHIPGLQAHDGAELVALCDQDPDRLSAAAEAYHVAKTYTDLEAMLAAESLDGAVIATNHASHYPLAKLCLEHGLHVMIEKPLTLYAWEAQALVALAQQQGRELIVGYPYNYTPYALRTREVLQSGELGAIQYISCVFTSHIFHLLQGQDSMRTPVHGPGDVYSDPVRSGGGHGHLQMTHPLGLLFFTTGLRMARVNALMHNHGLALDLVDAMTVSFEGGTLGSIGGTGNLGGGGGRKFDLQIYAESGSIDIDACLGTATIYRQGQPPESVEPVVGENDYRRFYTANNLVEVINGQADNGSPGEIGWRVVELLDAAYRSAGQDGGTVQRAELYG